MNTNPLNVERGDSLDDLLGARTETVRAPVTPPASYQPKDFSEPCPKCRGTGRFVGWSGRSFGQCFTCKGKGKKTFTTSPERRAQSRASKAAAESRKADAAIEDFKALHPALWAWMDGSTFDFAVSLLGSLRRYGSLTENQIAAAYRALDRLEIAKAAREAEKAAREAQMGAAPVVDGVGVDRLKAAFDAARAYAEAKGKGITIRNPKIFIGEMVISPAKAGSKNEGALYVKGGRGFEAPYLGKIAGGKFFAARECSPDQQAKVLAFIADPKAAAEAHGQETGVCCVCGATLTSEWRVRGIGPICARKMGW